MGHVTVFRIIIHLLSSDSDYPQIKISCFCIILLTFSWFHPTTEAMVHKEVIKHVKDLIVKRYWSGEGCKSISKTQAGAAQGSQTKILDNNKYSYSSITLYRSVYPCCHVTILNICLCRNKLYCLSCHCSYLNCYLLC